MQRNLNTALPVTALHGMERWLQQLGEVGRAVVP